MSRHYTARSFFRQVPNALLARYFAERGLLVDLDFTAMKETDPSALFDAWLALPEAQRGQTDAAFQEIFEMSCEKGFRAIIDEARWQMQAEPERLATFIETLSELPDHYQRAMITYLDYGECWRGAIRFYHADSLQYWRKRKNLGHQPAAVDKSKVVTGCPCKDHQRQPHLATRRPLDR